MTTLADLLTTQTVTQIFQTLLGVYQAAGFPVQSWQVGGVERTRLMAYATALADISGNYVPTISAGGLVDYASGAWLTLLAAQVYNLDRILAGSTVGDITLTAATGVASATYQPGQLKATFGLSGKSYLSNEVITIPAGPGSVVGEFKAEFTGASYNDPSSSGNLVLSTPIPGVTLTNPAGTFGSVAHVGAGTGTLTLAGSPVGPHLVVVRIDTTGQSGVASWSYSLDGATYVSAGAVASIVNLGGVGINITLVNVDSPSFIANDTYTFQTPGSWITAQGTDDETDLALQGRCRARWTTLAAIGTQSLYELLVKATPGSGSQVTFVIVQPDSNINNKLNIILSGPGGVLPAGVISDVQAFVNKRVPTTIRAFVSSPSTLAVTIVGIVTCDASLLVAVQAAVATAMTNYINTVGVNGTIKISKIIDLIMSVAGVTDVASVTINAAAANLTLGSSTTFQLASPLTQTFSYVTAAATS